MIEFNDICKTYRVARRESGLGNAVKSLFKREYTTIHAINHINFSIEDGEMVGYIGPNGAGKSTTIRLIMDAVERDGGSVTVLGKDNKSRYT